MEKAGERRGSGASHPHRQGLAGPQPALPLSWFGLPAAGTPCFPTYSNFTTNIHVPFMSHVLFGWGRCHSPFLPFPPPFSASVPASPGCTWSLGSSDRRSFFSSHFFFAQGQIVVSSKSFADAWVPQHVSNDHLGDAGETVQLRWRRTPTQVMGTPGWIQPVITSLYALPFTARSHFSFVHWPQDPGRGPTQSGLVVRVHRDG